MVGAATSMQERTCAMVVVGNEILSGKVHDTNSYFAARELRRVGVTLKRISVVPDELRAIAEEVAQCSRTHDFVLTSGGVGPTHDDITIEAIALAFERRLVVHPQLEELIRAHFTEPIGAGMKMAAVPEGAILNAAGDVRFPTVQIENVYILPGIPQLFEHRLSVLLERFATDPYFIRVIYTTAGEGTIAAHLNECLQKFPDLMLGSYPRIGDSEFRVKLTLESKDQNYLQKAFNCLMALLPAEAIVKIE
jgi:molybdenum cofactor synthesis domain-containing protein